MDTMLTDWGPIPKTGVIRSTCSYSTFMTFGIYTHFRYAFLDYFILLYSLTTVFSKLGRRSLRISEDLGSPGFETSGTS